MSLYYSIRKKEKNMTFKFIEITHTDFNDLHDTIPTGYDLVVVEHSDIDNNTFDSAMTLYGYDEIGLYDNDFNKPIHGYLSIEVVGVA
jgi:hypothetical protein